MSTPFFLLRESPAQLALLESGFENPRVGHWYVMKYQHVAHFVPAAGPVEDDNGNPLPLPQDDGMPVLRSLNYLIVRITSMPTFDSARGETNFIHNGIYSNKSWQQSGFHGNAVILKMAVTDDNGAWCITDANFSWMGVIGNRRDVRFLALNSLFRTNTFWYVSLGFHEQRLWCITYYTRTKSACHHFKRWVINLPLTRDILEPALIQLNL